MPVFFRLSVLHDLRDWSHVAIFDIDQSCSATISIIVVKHNESWVMDRQGWIAAPMPASFSAIIFSRSH
jgi:hypothetical protein